MESGDLKSLIGKDNVLENLFETYTDMYGDDYERVKAFVKEVVE